jgi:uncharacterized membrane protein
MERKAITTNHFSVRQLTVIGMLSAISIVLGATGLGFIPIPPVKATIMHLPVIIGAIIEGPVVGAMVGLVFGIFSIIQAITSPTPVSFVFLNPLVSVLPRVLIGIVSYYIYKAVPLKAKKYDAVKIGISAAVGTLTNTVGVLGFIYLLYLKRYAAALNLSIEATKAGIVGVGITNGIPEILVCMAIAIPVVLIIKKVRK